MDTKNTKFSPQNTQNTLKCLADIGPDAEEFVSTRACRM